MSEKVSHVASGFRDDCAELIDHFMKSGSIRYETFANVWQNMRFSLVFISKKTYAELLEFCEESLNIAKSFVLSSVNLPEQVGGLFLLYGLFYKMPIPHVKIRVTRAEWEILLQFHATLKVNEYYDASYTFIKLIYDHAFIHCLFENELGFESKYKSSVKVPFDNPYSVLKSVKEDLEDGDLQQLISTAELYIEKKSQLSDENMKIKLRMFKEDLPEFIEDKIQSLIRKRSEPVMPKRLKREDKTAEDAPLKIYKYPNADKIRTKIGHAFDTDDEDENPPENAEILSNPLNDLYDFDMDTNDVEDEILEEKVI